MKKLIVLILFMGVSLSVFADESKFLCHGDEQIVFACTVGTKMVSVCASQPLTKTSGYFQYRYGTPQKIELEYPAQPESPQGHFFLSQRMYSGGGATRIRFQKDGYDYFVYDSMIRTNFKAGEPNNPRFDAGVITRFKGKTTSLQHCKEDASVHSVGFDQLPREDYDDHLNP